MALIRLSFISLLLGLLVVLLNVHIELSPLSQIVSFLLLTFFLLISFASLKVFLQEQKLARRVNGGATRIASSESIKITMI